jgi:hypothetical protein
MTNHVLSKPDVEVNGVVIEELKGADVDVALTKEAKDQEHHFH